MGTTVHALSKHACLRVQERLLPEGHSGFSTAQQECGLAGGSKGGGKEACRKLLCGFKSK